jgi:glycine oxidase
MVKQSLIPRCVEVLGAGIAGLWQAYTLARRGHSVRLVERTATPFSNAASGLAGAMLSPYCERAGADPVVQELGLRGVALWREAFPGVASLGSLVVALPRDHGELMRFAERTEGHQLVDAGEIARLEPDLAGRFRQGLFFQGEAHLEPAEAMAFLLDATRRLGAEVVLGGQSAHVGRGLLIDCRGIAASGELAMLRGVRGERAVVQTREIALRRPVRLLHPRHDLYVVPWPMGTYMIGATMVETGDSGPATLRSTLDLLGLAYALHPGFGEARIVSLDAGPRPALPDNLPHIIVNGGTIRVNGLFRHGFLLAPVLAEAVSDYLETGDTHPLMQRGGSGGGRLDAHPETAALDRAGLARSSESSEEPSACEEHRCHSTEA